MSTVVSKDGTSIAFDKVGEGKAVILVGGSLDLGTRAYPMISELAALLSRHFTVLSYDRRGRGDSGDTLPYAVERELEDIAALITEGGGTASLCGFSSGAALALRAAAKFGESRIANLVLYEPPYSLGEKAKQDFFQYTAQTNSLLEAGKRSDAVTLFLSDMLPAEMLTVMRESPAWSKLETLAHTLAYDNAVMGEDGLVPVEFAQAVTVPTLLVCGSATLDFMREAADVLTEALPQASQRTIAGQDHAVTPTALEPVLREFFGGGS